VARFTSLFPKKFTDKASMKQTMKQPLQSIHRYFLLVVMVFHRYQPNENFLLVLAVAADSVVDSSY
jgi:hypothetical protein